MPSLTSRPGAVEPLSLVALILLVVTLAIGTAVTSNTKKSFELRREGSVLQATSGCGLDRFGECGGTCGGGTCGWQGSICGCIYPTSTPTPRPTATPVPTATPIPTSTCDPDAWSAWSACSAGCGGGTQSRTNQCGTRQTQSCNTQSCSLPSPTPTFAPTPTPVPSGGGGTAQPTATPNPCSYTCTSSGICSAEGGTAIVSQVCSGGSTCCNFQTQQPSSPQPTPTPARAAPRPTAAPGSTITAPSLAPATSSSGQCFWGASTCSAFGRYSGSGCTNCPSGVASCCGIVIPASADACLNSVGQHVDTRCVSSTRVAVCRSDKSGYNTQDCAGGWSCSGSTGRCAPPPTPAPALNFNPQTALTPQGTYTVSSTTTGSSFQNSFVPANDPLAIENSQIPSWGDVAQYYGQQAASGFYQFAQTASTSQGSANLVIGATQGLADYGTTLTKEAICASPQAVLYDFCRNLGVAERMVGGLNALTLGGLQATVETFNKYGETNALANQYGLATNDPRRVIAATQAGVAVTGLTAYAASPWINPETVAGRPLSSTYDAIVAASGGSLLKTKPVSNILGNIYDNLLTYDKSVGGTISPREFGRFTTADERAFFASGGVPPTPYEIVAYLFEEGSGNNPYNAALRLYKKYSGTSKGGIVGAIGSNSYEDVLLGQGNCLQCARVSQEFLAQYGIESRAINYSTGLLPHYGLYIPESGIVLMPGGKEVPLKALQRLVGKP